MYHFCWVTVTVLVHHNLSFIEIKTSETFTFTSNSGFKWQSFQKDLSKWTSFKSKELIFVQILEIIFFKCIEKKFFFLHEKNVYIDS